MLKYPPFVKLCHHHYQKPPEDNFAIDRIELEGIGIPLGWKIMIGLH